MVVSQKEDTLLTLRKCSKGSPVALARALEIPRSTARHRIQMLEEEGIVIDYTPVVTPQTFGNPYLIQIDINPENYKINTDIADTIQSLKDSLNTGIGHAPLCFYVFKDYETDFIRVHLLTMTFDIAQIIDAIYHKQNIARENISFIILEEADGVPNYSKFSLRQEG